MSRYEDVKRKAYTEYIEQDKQYVAIMWKLKPEYTQIDFLKSTVCDSFEMCEYDYCFVDERNDVDINGYLLIETNDLSYLRNAILEKRKENVKVQ